MRAYETYTKGVPTQQYRFTTTSIFLPFDQLPESVKEVWRKIADEVARWTIIYDSGRQDLD